MARLHFTAVILLVAKIFKIIPRIMNSNSRNQFNYTRQRTKWLEIIKVTARPYRNLKSATQIECNAEENQG